MAEKKQEKKKSGGSAGKLILLLLLLIIVILAALFLLDPFGMGWGFGFGAGGNKGTAGAGPDTSQSAAAETTAAVTQEQDAVKAEEPVYIDVKLSGSTYFYLDKESSVEEIIKAVKEADGSVTVRITDDSATQNAMEALTKELDKDGITYTIGG